MSVTRVEYYKEANKGNYIVDKAYEFLPTRYRDASIVDVFIDDDWCGYKMIPGQCRVDPKKFPIFNPVMPQDAFWPVGEIEEWICETVRINEQDIDFESYIKDNFEEMRDQVYINLIFVSKIKEGIPYRKFHIFHIIYELEIIVDEIIFRLTIDNDLLKQWGISVEELDAIAMTNSIRDLPAVLRTGADANTGTYNLLLGDKPDTIDKTYVLENEGAFFGVSVLAYPGVLEKVAEILDDDFFFYVKNPSYIILSAQHENYDGTLIKMRRWWNPMVCSKELFSPFIHEYIRDKNEIIM